jgi:hypothetical protein
MQREEFVQNLSLSKKLTKGFNNHIWKDNDACSPEDKDASDQRNRESIQRRFADDHPEGEERDGEEVREEDMRFLEHAA